MVSKIAEARAQALAAQEQRLKGRVSSLPEKVTPAKRKKDTVKKIDDSQNSKDEVFIIDIAEEPAKRPKMSATKAAMEAALKNSKKSKKRTGEVIAEPESRSVEDKPGPNLSNKRSSPIAEKTKRVTAPVVNFKEYAKQHNDFVGNTVHGGIEDRTLLNRVIQRTSSPSPNVAVQQVKPKVNKFSQSQKASGKLLNKSVKMAEERRILKEQVRRRKPKTNERKPAYFGSSNAKKVAEESAEEGNFLNSSIPKNRIDKETESAKLSETLPRENKVKLNVQKRSRGSRLLRALIFSLGIYFIGILLLVFLENARNSPRKLPSPEGFRPSPLLTEPAPEESIDGLENARRQVALDRMLSDELEELVARYNFEPEFIESLREAFSRLSAEERQRLSEKTIADILGEPVPKPSVHDIVLFGSEQLFTAKSLSMLLCAGVLGFFAGDFI